MACLNFRLARCAFLLIVLPLLSPILNAAEEKDQVFLKNGDVIIGDIVQRTTGMIAVRTHDGTILQIQRYDIENIYSPVKSWRALFSGATSAANEASGAEPASTAETASPADNADSSTGGDSGGARTPLSDIPRLSSLYAREYPRAAPGLEKTIVEMLGTL